MREIIHQARRRGSALAVAVVALGFVADPAYAQRRGGMSVPLIPPRPANINSSPMIDGLNKVLRTLGETDLDYDGHRQKAIAHIGAAIRDLEVPNPKARGRGNAAGVRPVAGKPGAKTGTIPQEASDAIVRKALSELFKMHHKLAEHGATVGRIHADSEVRIAISELGLALKTSTPTEARASTPSMTGK